MKQLLALIVVAYLVLLFTGFSWGGPSNTLTDRISYFGLPVYDTRGLSVVCWILPFERYYSDNSIATIDWKMYSIAYSGRCNGLIRK